MSRYLLFVSLFVCSIFNSGCGCSSYRSIPSGYAAKMLTPMGFQGKVLTSGQVDIGTESSAGEGNTLVLIENSSITVKESFLGREANPDHEDHRIVLQEDKVPMSVDVRIIFMSPDFSHQDSDKLFTLVTPDPWEKDARIKVISLEKVYNSQARLEARSAIRKVFDNYGKNWKYSVANRNLLNDHVAADVIKAVDESGIPLKVKNVEISMLMPDEAIWKAEAAITMAKAQMESIKELAREIDKLPNGLEIYRLLMFKETVQLNKSGTNTVVCFPFGGETFRKILENK